MKKTYLLGMALIGSLAFQACSKTEDESTASGESKAQVITLAVVNGSSSSTRAGRPLLSSEPNHTIENVTVYVVNEIPYIAGATQLRLVSSDENNNLILGQFANADMTDNGTGSGITTAVVNGASSGSEFDNVLATIDLGE